MNIKLTQTLPKTHTQKILKKEAKSKDAACLVVLIDDKKNILAEAALSDYQTRIKQLMEVSHFNGKACETVADYALAGDKKTAKENPVQLLLVGVGNIDKLGHSVLQKIANTIYQSTQKRVDSITVALGDALEENHFGQFALNLLAALVGNLSAKAFRPPATLALLVMPLLALALKLDLPRYSMSTNLPSLAEPCATAKKQPMPSADISSSPNTVTFNRSG